jgi:hypothetical protein
MRRKPRWPVTLGGAVQVTKRQERSVIILVRVITAIAGNIKNSRNKNKLKQTKSGSGTLMSD